MFFSTLPYWFFVLLLVVGVLGAESLQKKPLQQLEIAPVTSTPEELDLINWAVFVQDHPTYLYAHFQLAVASWRKGEQEAAVKYLHQAQKINPNHPQVKLLEKLIGN